MEVPAVDQRDLDLGAPEVQGGLQPPEASTHDDDTMHNPADYVADTEGRMLAMKFGIALVRAVVGGLFIGHGLQKLVGAFGGPGLEGTAGFFEQLGLHPAKAHASAAAVTETVGGAALLAGVATPAAAAALTGTMTVAVQKVHGANGVWSQNGGYEYNAVLTALLFAITADGPGSPSLGKREWGLGWAFAQLAAGVAGGLAMIKFGEMNAPAAAATAAQEEAPEPQPAAA